MFRLRTQPANDRQGGFALLVTITLVAFLVLVLVALATLTRVETQVASNSQQVNQARQNALMALNIAIGQLQKYAGPDQRVTTTADITATKDKTGATSPASISSTAAAARMAVQPGTRNWTAVWGNNKTNIGYDLRPNQISGRGQSPVVLNWLISGNESVALSLNGSDGGVNAAGSIPFTPVQSIAGLDQNSTATTSLTFPDSTPGILLVGPGTTSDGTIGTKNPENYVVAPMEVITAPAGTLPGVNTAETVGRYAYWVGDEGVKARVNLQNGYLGSGKNTEQVNSFIISQRAGIEFVDKDWSNNRLGAGAEGYVFDNANIPSVVQLEQLPMLGSIPDARQNLDSTVKARFHDLTSHSYSVLADTYAGGLKKDLTADIADTSANTSYRPSDDTSIFKPNSNTDNLPTWGHLRSWARANPDAFGKVSPQLPDATHGGISPVIVSGGVGFDIRLVPPDNTISVALFPSLILSNPYPFTLKAHNYTVGFRLKGGNSGAGLWRFHIAEPYDDAKLTIPVAAGGYQGTTITDEASYANYIAFANSPPSYDSPAYTLDVKTMKFVPGLPADTTPDNDGVFIEFNVECQDIPPGETHVYRLEDSQSETDYSPGKTLVRIPSPGSEHVTNHLLLRGPQLGAGVSGDHFMKVTTLGSKGLASRPNEELEIALAEPLQLMTNTLTGRYQSIVNTTLYAKTSHSEYIVIGNSKVDLKVSKSWSGLTEGARGSLRVGSAWGGRGQPYSTTGNFGVYERNDWMIHGNLRAPIVQPTALEAEMGVANSRNGATIMGLLLVNSESSELNNEPLPYVPNGYAMSIGGSYGSASSPPHYAILFDILKSPDRLLSIGQLQHAPFSRYGFQMGNAFGNSLADVRISREKTFLSGNMVKRPLSTTYDQLYDLSWHLNRAVWDRYFVSGVPTSWTSNDMRDGLPLPNARMTYRGENGGLPALDDIKFTGSSSAAYDKAAANLLVSGGFNINSTSEQAWRAVLGGTSGLPVNTDFATTDDNVGNIVPYPRFSNSLSRDSHDTYLAVNNPMVTETATLGNDMYLGNRGLNPNDSTLSPAPPTSSYVNELARTMVQEVRKRGPFLSLADFINRSPNDTGIGESQTAAGIKGALQTAIDHMRPTVAEANPLIWAGTGSNPNLTSETSLKRTTWIADNFVRGPTSGPEAEARLDSSYRAHYAFSPKFLTQADILSTLGPSLSARSDTFTIRTYGEAINPVTKETIGRSWCEAVVQRMPDYVGGDAPETATDAPTLSAESQAFGRKFVVVSFRWLSPSEI